jgi:hypothetical protein
MASASLERKHSAEQFTIAVVASYFGSAIGWGLYFILDRLGFSFQVIAGDLSVFFFSFGVFAPVSSVCACALASCYLGRRSVSKAGLLLSVVFVFLGVIVAVTLLDLVQDSVMLVWCWPAVVGTYAFLGYQAGIIVGSKTWKTRGQTVPGKFGKFPNLEELAV